MAWRIKPSIDLGLATITANDSIAPEGVLVETTDVLRWVERARVIPSSDANRDFIALS